MSCAAPKHAVWGAYISYLGLHANCRYRVLQHQHGQKLPEAFTVYFSLAQVDIKTPNRPRRSWLEIEALCLLSSVPAAQQTAHDMWRGPRTWLSRDAGPDWRVALGRRPTDSWSAKASRRLSLEDFDLVTKPSR